MKIYNTARAAPTPALNALATLMLLASLVAVVLGLLIYRWLRRGEQGRLQPRELHRRSVRWPSPRSATSSAVRPGRPRRAGRLVSLDPMTGEPWAEAPDSDAADVAEAVDCGRRGVGDLAAHHCPASGWTRCSRRQRCSPSRPTSWPSWRCRHRQAARSFVEDELPPTLDQVRFFAGAARLLEGRAAGEYEQGITSGVRREPVGVCAGITPWNYPLMMAVWKWAPAVAAGNTVVLKPSELTPVSTVLMAEVLAGVLPPGVVNVVCGGPAGGAALAAHPDVAQVSLTGSVRAGRAVATAAAERLARTHLELGGNAPAVVLADADLAAAAEGIAAGAYLNAGQDCTAASRVLVARPAGGRLVELLGCGRARGRRPELGGRPGRWSARARWTGCSGCSTGCRPARPSSPAASD